jgi:serine/threonine protein kinase
MSSGGIIVDAGTFFDHLRQSRLLSDDQFRQAQARFAGREPEEAAAGLLSAGALTPFQARQLCAGEGRRLTLGQYRLLDELGRGGMGSVYKALHTIMDRVVAIKVILPELVQNSLGVEWFRREVRAVTQLHHPNIVMAYDANEAEGLHFLVMEYVEGINLDAMVKRHGPLGVSQTCELMRQAAQALQYAHEKGLVHRDVKPGNLLLPLPDAVRADTEPLVNSQSSLTLPPVLVKVVDFGLARLQTTAQNDTIMLKTQAGFMGTPDYCSPEQSRDIHSADIRSDLYSLGCTFYYALTGRVPFPAESPMDKLVKHLMEEPTPLEKVRPQVPTGVAVLVRRLMAKDPSKRYQTPAELAEDLVRWCAASTRPSVYMEAPVAAGSPDAEGSATSLLDRVPIYAFDDGVLRRVAEPGDPEAGAEEAEPSDWVSPAAETKSHPDTAIPGTAPAAPASTPVAEPPAPLPAGSPDLLELWREWSAVVKRFASCSGFYRLNPESYRVLYQHLLDACRRHAAADAARADYFQRLEAIVRPWMSLQTFRQTDATMLQALWRQCRCVEWELSGGREPVKACPWLLLLALLVGPTAVVVWFFTFGSRWLASLSGATGGQGSILAQLRGFGAYMELHPSYWVAAFVPAVIVISIYWLSRPSRS